MKINELKLNKKLLENVSKIGYVDSTPIQEQAIPEILNKKDILGIAQTGSGKTAAFALPMISMRMNESHDERVIRNLIVTPTRELAIQIRDNVRMYTSDNIDFKVTAIVGGVNIREQAVKLRRPLDLVVATPGRLCDLIKQRKIKIDNVDMLVLDEADTMLDMGFINDIKKIISKIKQPHQTMMFSATMPEEIFKLSQEYLNEPIRVEVVPDASELPKIEQQVFHVKQEDKKDCLLNILTTNRIEQALIFTKTKIGADKLEKYLKEWNLKVAVIHGDKRQGCRLRSLKDFKSGKVNYLIATDIAARGIDITGLPYVINFNLPEQSEVYIHRIGRTGRAGEKGIAVSIVSNDELRLLSDIEKLIDKKLDVVNDGKYTISVVRKESGRSHRSHKLSEKKKYSKQDNSKTYKSKENKFKEDKPKAYNSKENKFKEDKPKAYNSKENKFKENKPKNYNQENKKKFYKNNFQSKKKDHHNNDNDYSHENF